MFLLRNAIQRKMQHLHLNLTARNFKVMFCLHRHRTGNNESIREFHVALARVSSRGRTFRAIAHTIARINTARLQQTSGP